jgi:hypothetical protein
MKLPDSPPRGASGGDVGACGTWGEVCDCCIEWISSAMRLGSICPIIDMADGSIISDERSSPLKA